MMTTFVSDYEPRALWRRFDEILTVYRPSKGEDAMRRHVIEAAGTHGLEHERDEAGNLVVHLPATPGHEDAPVTVLQSHLDMVYEKNSDVDHDFATDPIVAERDGAYLTARGTTLGSDNGIGVAAMLALMDLGTPPEASVVHGPLELLFTIDEESGLTGAAKLSPNLLTGRRLLNLDTEEEGALYVGCAGGLGSRVSVPLVRHVTPAGEAAFELAARGFKGGHSGVDIHLQRGNAIKLLARAIDAGTAAAGGGAADGDAAAVRLAGFSGGSAHNAIPREAFATVVLPADRAGDFRAAFEREAKAIVDEYLPVDPDARLDATPAGAPAETWDAETSARVIRLLVALPHGVASWSYDIPDLVETSTTLATVAETDGALEALLSSRSSVDTAIRARARHIRAIAALAGASSSEEGGYPGWKPDMSSELLAVLQRVHERELGSAPAVKAIHAGLECGIIGEKVPGMDMISFGPQIEFPHSPDERVHVDSVGRFWKLLTAVLEELA
jgi:dipeptidase D